MLNSKGKLKKKNEQNNIKYTIWAVFISEEDKEQSQTLWLTLLAPSWREDEQDQLLKCYNVKSAPQGAIPVFLNSIMVKQKWNYRNVPVYSQQLSFHTETKSMNLWLVICLHRHIRFVVVADFRNFHPPEANLNLWRVNQRKKALWPGADSEWCLCQCLIEKNSSSMQLLPFNILCPKHMDFQKSVL